MDPEFGDVTYNEYSVTTPKDTAQDASPQGTHLTVLRGIGAKADGMKASFLQIWVTDDTVLDLDATGTSIDITASSGSIAWIGIDGKTFNIAEAYYIDTLTMNWDDGSTSEVLYLIDYDLNIYFYALSGPPLLAGEKSTEDEATDFLLATYYNAENITYGIDIANVEITQIENSTQRAFTGTLEDLQTNLTSSPDGTFEYSPNVVGPDTTGGTNTGTDGAETDTTDGSGTDGGTESTDLSTSGDTDTGDGDEGDDTSQTIVGAVGVTTTTDASGDIKTETDGTTTVSTTEVTDSGDGETEEETESQDLEEPLIETDTSPTEETSIENITSETYIKNYNEIAGTEYSDLIQGSDIEDHIFAFEGNDTVYALDGNDLVYGNSGDDSLFGGDGDDEIYASDGDDFIEGGAGNDSISAGNGDDTIVGGKGDDVLKKLSGAGHLDGGSGQDIVIGGYNSDHLAGGDGNDILIGDISVFLGGLDTVDGGAGNDILSGGIGADSFIFRPNEGQDTIAGVDILLAQTSAADSLSLSADWTAQDRIHLVGFESINASTVMSHIVETAEGALFSAEGTSILFYGVSSDDLSTDHFVFG